MDLLPKPNLEKELSSGENNILRYSSCAMQGWRKRMEDAHITDISKGENDRFNIFGIFDGHGGKEVAEFVSNHFTENFLKNENIKKNNIKQAIIDTFLKMDELMFEKDGIEELKLISKKCQEQDKLFFQKNNIVETPMDIYIQNLLNGKAYRMSVDHKPELELEKNRIEKADGWVSENGRINGNLNLSRTLGDLEFKKNKNLKPQEQIITSYPDVVDDNFEDKNDFIVIGCDGIWDCIQDQDICDIISERINKENDKYKANLENILTKIFNNIYAKKPFDILKGYDGYDNMSCILIQIKK